MENVLDLLFKKGDYVEVRFGRGTVEGEVSSANQDEIELTIDFATGSLFRNIGKKIKVSGIKTFIEQDCITRIEKDTGLSERDLQLLINLALDTKDQVWFTELSKRKRQLSF